MTQNICPVCKSEISSERLASLPIICQSCGFIHSSANQRVDSSMNKTSILVMTGLSILTAVTFLHSVRWGSHSLEVITLKISTAIGFGSDSTFERMQEICKERKMVECVQTALEDQLLDDPKNLEALKKLGKLHYQRKNFSEASTVLNEYFQNGGDDLMSAYYFAKVLSHEGLTDKASEYFDFILASKPDVLQVTVTEAYIDMLMQADRYQEAQKLAKSVEARTDSVPGTLLSRFETVEENIKSAKN